MHRLKQYRIAEVLEQYLGDPATPDNACSFKRSVELDEREEYPEEACKLLYQWRLHHYYIPLEFGGSLKSYEELLSIMRVVARRDLTVAIAFGSTYLGAVGIWVGGTDEQKHKLSKMIKNNHQIALGLTEREHGSDLLASEVQATQFADGYVLSGQKWLINNATHAMAITVFARTDTQGGPRGFSLLLVEKKGSDKATYSHLPKVKTLGVRGADISGIRFDDSRIPADSLIGTRGFGLEITLKSLQITRTLCAGLSLGAANTALQAALGFALSRRLYGDAVFAIPHAQSILIGAFLDLLTCDCAAIAATRGLHVATNQFSVWSAVVKYFVPVTVENIIRDLSVILGARYYLREGYEWGIFQKILRDNAIVSLFDGSSPVNLQALALQLRSLSNYHAKLGLRGLQELKARLECIFTLEKILPVFDPNHLELFNQGRDDVLQGMEMSLRDLLTIQTEDGVDQETLATILTLTSYIIDEINVLYKILADLVVRYGRSLNKSPELFQLAKDYCTLHVASTCVHMWIHNRNLLDDFFSKGEWLVLCLNRLLMSFRHSGVPYPHSYAENVGQELVKRHKEGKLFSIVAFQIARTSKKEGE